MATTETKRRVDPEFKHKLREVLSGDSLRYCYQCGSCTASCPMARFIDTYRPNKILELAKLGIRGTQSGNAVLMCSACTLCTRGCPQGVRVHEIMNALKDLAAEDGYAQKFLEKGFLDALEALGEGMPFPVSYSWICLRPSESDQAARGEFDRQVLDVLRGWLARPESQSEKRPAANEALSGKAVAVIGAGPAGLTAAWTLARMGLRVTVFESLPEAGGMLSIGIPNDRLPREIVDAEIDRIRALGVEIRTSAAIDESQFDSLLENGQFQAVLVATGAHATRKIRVEGEDQANVIPALDFLRQYNRDCSYSLGKKVVVIGGGNVAIDAARSAVHCGAESVQLFCLESRTEMPAHKWEIQEAADEGVILNPSWGPRRITGDGQTATGVEFVRCTSVFDSERRFRPQFDEKKTMEVEADTIISAIGQAPNLAFLGQRIDLARGVVAVDPLTLEASRPGVYAGGDAVQGTASLIEAIVAGRTAAESISRYLSGEDVEQSDN